MCPPCRGHLTGFRWKTSRTGLPSGVFFNPLSQIWFLLATSGGLFFDLAYLKKSGLFLVCFKTSGGLIFHLASSADFCLKNAKNLVISGLFWATPLVLGHYLRHFWNDNGTSFRPKTFCLRRRTSTIYFFLLQYFLAMHFTQNLRNHLQKKILDLDKNLLLKMQ